MGSLGQFDIELLDPGSGIHVGRQRTERSFLIERWESRRREPLLPLYAGARNICETAGGQRLVQGSARESSGALRGGIACQWPQIAAIESIWGNVVCAVAPRQLTRVMLQSASNVTERRLRHVYRRRHPRNHSHHRSHLLACSQGVEDRVVIQDIRPQGAFYL